MPQSLQDDGPINTEKDNGFEALFGLFKGNLLLPANLRNFGLRCDKIRLNRSALSRIIKDKDGTGEIEIIDNLDDSEKGRA